MNRELIQRLTDSRKRLDVPATIRKEAEEGGCGGVGFCCSEPVAGRHISGVSRQSFNDGGNMATADSVSCLLTSFFVAGTFPEHDAGLLRMARFGIVRSIKGTMS